VLEVAHEGDGQPLHAAQLAENREQIEQGLCRMLASAVASVQHRDVQAPGGLGSRSRLGQRRSNALSVTLGGTARIAPT
jgi:hypothetical protein